MSVIHSIIEYVFVDVKEIMTFINRFIDCNIDKIFVMELEKATAFYSIYCETCWLNKNIKQYLRLFRYFPDNYGVDFTLDTLNIDPGTLYALILIHREELDHWEIHE